MRDAILVIGGGILAFRGVVLAIGRAVWVIRGATLAILGVPRFGRDPDKTLWGHFVPPWRRFGRLFGHRWAEIEHVADVANYRRRSATTTMQRSNTTKKKS